MRERLFGESLPKALVLAICLVCVSCVGFVDYVTGYEIRSYPLYFLPIAFGAWHLPRSFVLLLSLLSSGTWVTANFLAGGHYSSSYIWIFNAGVQAVAFGFVGLLIVELHRRLARERDLSRIDALTGLPNSRAFYERAELIMAIARRSDVPLTLAYLDLDNFKAVNDQHGHQEGDRALKTMGEILKRHSRASDVVARLGGDEFAMLLSNAGPDAASTTLERIRELAGAAMRENRWPVTVSVGALSFPRAPSGLDEAVQRADALMYRAKAAGKDRLHLERA